MSIIILMFLTLSASESKHNVGSSFQEYSLIKRSEIYLHRLKLGGRPWSKNLNVGFRFAHLPNGNSFLFERDKNNFGRAYFFKPNGELNKSILLKIPSRLSPKGKPDDLASITNTLTNSYNNFLTYDLSFGKLKLWDARGNLVRNFFLPSNPDFNPDKLILTGSFDYNTLAFGCFYLTYEEGKSICVPKALVFDQNDTLKPPLEVILLKDTTKLPEDPGPYYIVQVNVISEDLTACYVTDYPELYLIRKDGTVLRENTVPPHFRSIEDAAPPPVRKDTECGCKNINDDDGYFLEAMEEWVSTWTHSIVAPYKYLNNTLIVPRERDSTSYLDMYSYSKDSVSYLGYASIDNKKFLFADTSGVFMLERKDDTCVVVGKYSIITPDYRESRPGGWSNANLNYEQLAGIHKVPANKQEKPPKPPLETNISTLKLLSSDSIEYSLIDSLSNGKNHVILFVAPENYFANKGFKAAQKYWLNDSTNSDFTVVYIYPYPDEFMPLRRLMQCNHPIFTDIKSSNLKPFMRKEVSFLIVSKDGTVSSIADYPDFELKPVEEK